MQCDCVMDVRLHEHVLELLGLCGGAVSDQYCTRGILLLPVISESESERGQPAFERFDRVFRLVCRLHDHERPDSGLPHLVVLDQSDIVGCTRAGYQPVH